MSSRLRAEREERVASEKMRKIPKLKEEKQRMKKKSEKRGKDERNKSFLFDKNWGEL